MQTKTQTQIQTHVVHNILQMGGVLPTYRSIQIQLQKNTNTKYKCVLASHGSRDQ